MDAPHSSSDREPPLHGGGKIEEFTLYSLDGNLGVNPQGVEDSRLFRSFLVLGSVNVEDALVQQGLIDALQGAFAERPKEGARCFIPRHGLSVVRDGVRLEYVVCFQCSYCDEFVHDQHERMLIGSETEAAALFNSTLVEAGVRVAQ